MTTWNISTVPRPTATATATCAAADGEVGGWRWLSFDSTSRRPAGAARELTDNRKAASQSSETVAGSPYASPWLTA